jgi:hypothetical protein
MPFLRCYAVWLLGDQIFRRNVVTANAVPSSPILFTVMMGALLSSEISFLTRATPRNIPEDDILHSRRRENLKYYMWRCI